MPLEPIDVLCKDPRTTRDEARRGLPTPCYRCIAYQPHMPIACSLLNATRAQRRKPIHVDQSTIWPTHPDD